MLPSLLLGKHPLEALADPKLDLTTAEKAILARVSSVYFIEKKTTFEFLSRLYHTIVEDNRKI